MVHFDPQVPYNALPLLPPKFDLETRAVLKRTITARAAVEGLKNAAALIPDQQVLLRSIVLQEARSSSEIENIVTTNDEIYQALSDNGESDSPQVKEVIRYSRALWAGFELLRQRRSLDTDACTIIASQILETPTQIRAGLGTRVGNPRTGKVIYSPPAGSQLIQSLLANLSHFQTAATDLDPLIKIAVGHYQFEAIHPFTDGNGRTGRVLNILWMIEKELLDLPILYLSRAIIESKADYYSGLREVTEQAAWEKWLLYFLEIIEVTALETRRRIVAIRRAMDDATEIVRTQRPKIYSRELVELVFSQPYTRIQNLEDAGIAKRQSASVYLAELEKLGLLRREQKWRNTLFINDALMNCLT